MKSNKEKFKTMVDSLKKEWYSNGFEPYFYNYENKLKLKNDFDKLLKNSKKNST